VLPDDLVVAVANAGLFQMLVPCADGGSELDLPAYIQVIGEIAQADASTA
jgi:alkylation response protein AidB-like acyl-CoA dehydrogenase